jgi:hypothetical protein
VTGRKEERERLRQERLAAQRAAQSSDKRREYIGYAVAGLIVVAILAGLVVVITGGGGGDEVGVDASGKAFPELAYINEEIGVVPDGIEVDGRDGTDPPEVENAVLEEAAELAGCELRLDLEDEGNQHIEDDPTVADVEYKTDPPTSGDHYGNGSETASGALADGAYAEYPDRGRFVHSMEHGRVVIHYSPDLSEEEQLAIKGVFEESPSGVILVPNPEMDSEVAVAAWTQLGTCDTYEGAATLDLIRAFVEIYRGQGPEYFPLNV